MAEASDQPQDRHGIAFPDALRTAATMWRAYHLSTVFSAIYPLHSLSILSMETRDSRSRRRTGIALAVDSPPPRGESLEMCAERAVAHFKEHIEPQLQSGKNVMIAAHGNLLRSIIMYLERLTPHEVQTL